MLKLPTPRRITLDSGATLLYQRNPVSPSIAFGVWIMSGSKDEGEGERGLSHFVEHMVFRGTRDLSSIEIAIELESIGGQWDAFTGKESTCYHGMVLEEHFEKLVEVLSQIILHPTFPPESLELERKIIREEIASVRESPEETVHELFFETILEGHPLSHPVTGYAKDVSRYNRDDLVDFHRKNYTARNMIIGFIGNIPLSRVERIVNEKFRVKRGKVRAAPRFKPRGAGKVRSRRIRGLRQSHVCIGSLTVPASHPDRYAVVVLGNILGGGVTSKLFQSLRECSGLAYSVFSSANFWKDTGVLCNYFSVDARNLSRALEIFHGVVGEVASGRISKVELQSAISQIKGGVVFGIENLTNRLFRLFQNEFYHGRYVSPLEVVDYIERVDEKMVAEVACRFLDPDTFTYATCGPVSLRGLV